MATTTTTQESSITRDVFYIAESILKALFVGPRQVFTAAWDLQRLLFEEERDKIIAKEKKGKEEQSMDSDTKTSAGPTAASGKDDGKDKDSGPGPGKPGWGPITPQHEEDGWGPMPS